MHLCRVAIHGESELLLREKPQTCAHTELGAENRKWPTDMYGMEQLQCLVLSQTV